jgi:multidrug resistance efflux pump
MSVSTNLRVSEAVLDGSNVRSPARPSVATSKLAATPTEESPPLAALDAAGRIAKLTEAFEQADATQTKTVFGIQTGFVAKVWALHRRLLKTLLGLVVLITAGWMPVRALLETTSTEAVINARLITLRAPIEGQVRRLDAVAVGTELEPGTALVAIANPRADRARLDDLRRLVDELESESKALVDRRDELRALREELVAQSQAFRSGRIGQLEARVAELASEIAAAEARREEADLARARTEALETTGAATRVAVDRARRDAIVAVQTLTALGHRQTALKVELEGLRNGVYVGDSYNDRPQSLQRADDLGVRIAELSAEIRHRHARLKVLRAELTSETERHAERAGATLTAPVHGSIWEVMTAPGESVVRGQDLIRLLDCSGVVITATVGESAYNQLRIGDGARFRFRGDSVDYHGRVVGLTGVASAPANLAIQPTALSKEPYRVTVALPELAKSGQCNVGRTGRVTFK